MVKFDERIGEFIAISPKHPLEDGDSLPKTYKVKLVGVDIGGIWFEHEDATRRMRDALGEAGKLRSVAFFLPYSELYFAFVGFTDIDEQSLMM